MVRVPQVRCKLMATPNTKCSIPRDVNSGEASLCTPPPPLTPTLKLVLLEGEGGGRLNALFRRRLVAADENEDDDEDEDEDDDKEEESDELS